MAARTCCGFREKIFPLRSGSQRAAGVAVAQGLAALQSDFGIDLLVLPAAGDTAAVSAFTCDGGTAFFGSVGVSLCTMSEFCGSLASCAMAGTAECSSKVITSQRAVMIGIRERLPQQDARVTHQWLRELPATCRDASLFGADTTAKHECQDYANDTRHAPARRGQEGIDRLGDEGGMVVQPGLERQARARRSAHTVPRLRTVSSPPFSSDVTASAPSSISAVTIKTRLISRIKTAMPDT